MIIYLLAAANWFSFAFFSSDLQEMVDVVDHHQLFVKIEKAFPECDEEACLKIYENVLRCVGNKQYVCYLLFSATISLLSSTFFHNVRMPILYAKNNKTTTLSNFFVLILFSFIRLVCLNTLQAIFFLDSRQKIEQTFQHNCAINVVP